MPDNLTVQISANADKLRAELGKAQAAVRDLSKQFRAASEEARKTGDSTNLDRVSAQLNAATREVRGLTRALATQNAALDAAADGTSRFGAALATLDTRLGSIIGLGGGLKTFLAGFTVLQGAQAAISKVSDSLQHFRDMRNAAFGTTLPLDTVKAFDLAMRKAGISGEKSAGALIQFGGAAGDAMQKWEAANKELIESSGHFKTFGDAVNTATQSVNVARGGLGSLGGALPAMTRGAEKLDKMRDVFASIDIDITKFRDAAGKLDSARLFDATIKRLNALFKAGDIRAARAGSLLLGEDDIIKLSNAVKVYAEQLNNLKQTAQNLPPTKTDLENLDKYDQALGNLKIRWDGIWGAISAASLALDQDLVVGADRMLQGFEHVFGELKRGFGEIATGFSEAFTTAFNNIMTSAQSLMDWFWSQIAAIKSAISSAASAAGSMLSAPGGVLPAPGLAAGGMVRGAGTGSSDSILARLSNGEFVMRAGAVKYWGAGLMSAMNAVGPRFAAGGLVGAAAGGGTPVHLHLGGKSFALSGGADVVSSLVHEARRSQMRSAGVKPSWYGGTPGGR